MGETPSITVGVCGCDPLQESGVCGMTHFMKQKLLVLLGRCQNSSLPSCDSFSEPDSCLLVHSTLPDLHIQYPYAG